MCNDSLSYIYGHSHIFFIRHAIGRVYWKRSEDVTNYKRFISYLNYYELGNKKGNVGFVRVETSDEICKVTVHCALKAIPKKECKVHLLRRQASLVLSKEVGIAQLKDGLLDAKLSFEKGIVDEEGFHFNDCIGILLMYSKDNYIGAKWDGSGITYHEASLIDQNIDQNFTNQSTKAPIKVVFPEHPHDESKTTAEVAKVEPMNVESTKVESTKGEEAKAGATIQVVPTSEVEVVEQGSIQSKKVASALEEETKAETLEKEVLQQADSMVPDVKTEATKKAEFVEQMIIKEKESLDIKGALKPEMIKQHEFVQKEELPQPDRESIEEEEVLSVASSNVEAMNPWVDHPAARTILNRFVRMYPFDDGEMAECVRLEPKDIGLFPMSAWVLGNNSFVLHSYSSFRHLLFSKKLTREGCEYYFMVPGFYNSRERQLASMFGFEMFKGSRRRGPRGGEFGYWYVKILFE